MVELGLFGQRFRGQTCSLLLSVLLLLVAGCGPIDLFTGQWQSEAGTCQSVGPIPACTEIAIGQFGNDGAGIMRIYHNDAFNVPWPTCPCIHLRDGKKTGQTMTLVADLSLCPTLANNYPNQLTVALDSLDDFTAELRVEAIGEEQSGSSVSLVRLEDDLVKFDSHHPQRQCDPDTESGIGFESP